ncbi:unnamed protein product [Spirodela intermedia]|uniref:Protein kinase domain-containing protein n=1 Tax=Spirodela intermedia TaxID=51605 RepID=A0A7I8IJQ1_SPIIN|nr:unnamed protein product [Spirodela intermedia]CAA6657599.1 unnamed protein product [Spirodela intermedia]
MMSNIGWGRWYTLAELEAATGCFRRENVVGEGGYGIVYKGILPDSSVVAVKNLLDNRGQAEKEFKVEVEAIGKVRHKNLVGLCGYCDAVYEFIDNGNLEQWLHGDVGPVSPLTWDVRMKIAIGTAKGFRAKVVHRDVKLATYSWITSGIRKFPTLGWQALGSGSSYVTTRVMGTFGYVAPEYASTGMLNEGSDVYSFGVLLMKSFLGGAQMVQGMVGSRRAEELVDPLMEVQPSPRALKRVILVCLRCMGQIVHMLEGDEFPFRTSSSGDHGDDQQEPFEKVAGGTEKDRSIWR